MSQAPPFGIFFVCTGNQARSPLAAAWTARALAPLGVAVGSAGTMLRRPSPVLAEAATLGAELGLDLSRHSSSHVSAHDLSIADLVIGFEYQHVAAAVVDGGAPAAKAFLLKELVRLARDVPPPAEPNPYARARTVIAAADGLRRRAGHVHGQEIRDPAGRRPAAFREIVDEVLYACDEAMLLLFGP